MRGEIKIFLPHNTITSTSSSNAKKRRWAKRLHCRVYLKPRYCPFQRTNQESPKTHRSRGPRILKPRYCPNATQRRTFRSQTRAGILSTHSKVINVQFRGSPPHPSIFPISFYGSRHPLHGSRQRKRYHCVLVDYLIDAPPVTSALIDYRL